MISYSCAFVPLDCSNETGRDRSKCVAIKQYVRHHGKITKEKKEQIKKHQDLIIKRPSHDITKK